MLSNFTLRTRITLLTMLLLTIVTTSMSVLTIINARQHFLMPLEHLGIETDAVRILPRDGAYIDEAIAVPDGFVVFHQATAATASQSDFEVYTILIGVLFTLIGTIVAYLISGHALKPIKHLTESVAEIDENNLSTLIEQPSQNDEVSRLTASFNNMLNKLNRSFEIQKLFAQNAAHELKTPLASMRAGIDVLLMDDEPTIHDYQEVVNIVDTSTERLIKLVEGLLSINSIVDETAWQLFSGREVFESVTQELNESIAQKKVAVSISGDCRIKGDRSLLERAFLNLVCNAIRYNVDEGTVRISLSEGSIIIEDSGVGIPDEHLDRIFDPFYCVDKSRSKRLGGHGLGLAIAKNVFDRHHIDIRVLSEYGKGTKIILSRLKNFTFS